MATVLKNPAPISQLSSMSAECTSSHLVSSKSSLPDLNSESYDDTMGYRQDSCSKLQSDSPNDMVDQSSKSNDDGSKAISDTIAAPASKLCEALSQFAPAADSINMSSASQNSEDVMSQLLCSENGLSALQGGSSTRSSSLVEALSIFSAAPLDAVDGNLHLLDVEAPGSVSDEVKPAKMLPEHVELPEHVDTVMLKNIPCRCHRQEVIDLLAAHGWGESYNFFHLPAPPSTCKGWRGNLGYAFVGFPDSATAERFSADISGAGFPGRKSKKMLEVAPARFQGLDVNMAKLSSKRVLESNSSAPTFRFRF